MVHKSLVGVSGGLPQRPLPNLNVTSSTLWEGARFAVLAVGNPIMGDDRVGLEILAGLREKLAERPAWRRAMDAGELGFVEGGAGGMELVPVVQESERLLILDSISPGERRRPGEVMHLSGDHVPRLLSMKLSPHQVGLLDVLTAARLTKREPAVIEVVGIVSENIALTLDMSGIVQNSLERAIQSATEVLDAWLR